MSVAVLIGWLSVAANRRVLRLAPAGLWLAAGFGLLYLAMPEQLFGVSFVDLRVLVAAVLVLPAFLELPNRRWLVASLACIGAVTLANLAVVTTV